MSEPESTAGVKPGQLATSDLLGAFDSFWKESGVQMPEHMKAIELAMRELAHKAWCAAIKRAAANVEDSAITYACGDTNVLAERALPVIAENLRKLYLPNTTESSEPARTDAASSSDDVAGSL